jgi:hypothetical protein
MSGQVRERSAKSGKARATASMTAKRSFADVAGSASELGDFELLPDSVDEG